MITLDDGIELLDGSMFSFADPRSSSVTIEQIAHALGMVCRFAGHVSRFYSVAQHAVNVSLILPQDLALDGLLHDTAEAFTNDIPTPVKHRTPSFKDLEVVIEEAMAERFGTSYPMHPLVKLADLQMLKIEKETLKPSASNWAILDGIQTDRVEHLVNMDRMQPHEATRAFINRYWELAA